MRATSKSCVCLSILVTKSSKAVFSSTVIVLLKLSLIKAPASLMISLAKSVYFPSDTNPLSFALAALTA